LTQFSAKNDRIKNVTFQLDNNPESIKRFEELILQTSVQEDYPTHSQSKLQNCDGRQTDTHSTQQELSQFFSQRDESTLKRGNCNSEQSSSSYSIQSSDSLYTSKDSLQSNNDSLQRSIDSLTNSNHLINSLSQSCKDSQHLSEDSSQRTSNSFQTSCDSLQTSCDSLQVSGENSLESCSANSLPSFDSLDTDSSSLRTNRDSLQKSSESLETGNNSLSSCDDSVQSSTNKSTSSSKYSHEIELKCVKKENNLLQSNEGVCPLHKGSSQNYEKSLQTASDLLPACRNAHKMCNKSLHDVKQHSTLDEKSELLMSEYLPSQQQMHGVNDTEDSITEKIDPKDKHLFYSSGCNNTLCGETSKVCDENSDDKECHGGGIEVSLGVPRAVMVGLHCCGDLTPTMLSYYKQIDCVRALCCVSCCYHRMKFDGKTINIMSSNQLFKSD